MRPLSVAETAQILRASRQTIMRLIQAGELVAHRRGTTQTSPMEVDPTSVARYIDRCTVPARSDP